MKRATAVAVHVLALPVAILVSVLLAKLLAASRAEAFELHDTYFVVAHFHVSVLVCICLTVTTLVAYRFHSLNGLLGVAWAFLLLHFISVLVPWRPSGAVGSSSEGTFVITTPSYPGLAYVYIGSAVATFLATLLGLIMSLTRALQSSSADATRLSGQAGEP